jgi:CBS domain containing-hemolysin-like protein
MLMAEAYERMGLGKAPRAIAAKPMLSFMLETLGHLPGEEEVFLYENLEFSTKTVENGRVSEVVVHILDEEDLAQREASNIGEEVMA